MEQNGPWLPVSLQIPQEADFLFERKKHLLSSSRWIITGILQVVIPIDSEKNRTDVHPNYDPWFMIYNPYTTGDIPF